MSPTLADNRRALTPSHNGSRRAIFILSGVLVVSKSRHNEIVKLFKYRSVNSHLEALLTHHELYFPNGEQLNDLYDCAVRIDFSAGSPRQFQQLIRSFMPRLLPNISLPEGKMEEIVDRHCAEQMQNLAGFARELERGTLAAMRTVHGVYCLSERHDNVQMWAHYADGHRGVCLEMDGPEVSNSAREVQYVDTLPVIDYFAHSPEEVARIAMLSKQSNWAYEKEWRIIEPEFSPGVHRLRQSVVTGIIFGVKTPARDRAAVQAWSRLGGINSAIYEARPVSDGTRVAVVPWQAG